MAANTSINVAVMTGNSGNCQENVSPKSNVMKSYADVLKESLKESPAMEKLCETKEIKKTSRTDQQRREECLRKEKVVEKVKGHKAQTLEPKVRSVALSDILGQVDNKENQKGRIVKQKKSPKLQNMILKTPKGFSEKKMKKKLVGDPEPSPVKNIRDFSAQFKENLNFRVTPRPALEKCEKEEKNYRIFDSLDRMDSPENTDYSAEVISKNILDLASLEKSRKSSVQTNSKQFSEIPEDIPFYIFEHGWHSEISLFGTPQMADLSSDSYEEESIYFYPNDTGISLPNLVASSPLSSPQYLEKAKERFSLPSFRAKDKSAESDPRNLIGTLTGSSSYLSSSGNSSFEFLPCSDSNDPDSLSTKVEEESLNFPSPIANKSRASNTIEEQQKTAKIQLKSSPNTIGKNILVDDFSKKYNKFKFFKKRNVNQFYSIVPEISLYKEDGNILVTLLGLEPSTTWKKSSEALELLEPTDQLDDNVKPEKFDLNLLNYIQCSHMKVNDLENLQFKNKCNCMFHRTNNALFGVLTSPKY